MRIISGKYKGTNLHITKSKNTRPLRDMVRENIFNLLVHSKKISLKLEKSLVLDLYAGTGSFGLECLSREAKYVYFVENEKLAFKILQENIEKLNVKKQTSTFFNDVFNLIKKKNFVDKKFDLIFCDPPYKNADIKDLMQLIFYNNLLNKNGIIVLHRDKKTKEKLPNYLKVIEEKIYGISKIIFGYFLS